eukprot:m.183791 g.183791  ORF g.183791 m.183791 type:complete len:72 (+) comp32168_c3_seq2:2564-2779(+)
MMMRMCTGCGSSRSISLRSQLCVFLSLSSWLWVSRNLEKYDLSLNECVPTPIPTEKNEEELYIEISATRFF